MAIQIHCPVIYVIISKYAAIEIPFHMIMKKVKILRSLQIFNVGPSSIQTGNLYYRIGHLNASCNWIVRPQVWNEVCSMNNLISLSVESIPLKLIPEVLWEHCLLNFIFKPTLLRLLGKPFRRSGSACTYAQPDLDVQWPLNSHENIQETSDKLCIFELQIIIHKQTFICTWDKYTKVWNSTIALTMGNHCSVSGRWS